MKVIIKTNFPFDVQNIGFSSHGELVITLSSEGENPKNSCRQLLKIPQSSCKAILRSCLFYEAEFGESCASPKPIINLSSYIVSYLSKANIKDVTKSSYHLMMRDLRFFHTLSSIAS